MKLKDIESKMQPVFVKKYSGELVIVTVVLFIILFAIHVANSNGLAYF